MHYLPLFVSYHVSGTFANPEDLSFEKTIARQRSGKARAYLPGREY